MNQSLKQGTLLEGGKEGREKKGAEENSQRPNG